MNQKEYELLADILKSWRRIYEPDDRAYIQLVNRMASTFEVHYKSFDRGKFLEACGF